MQTAPGRTSREVRDLLRAPAPAAVGRGRRAQAASRTRSTQVELADRLGIDYVWEVEHHFLEEYSHSSAPEVFLAAASPAHAAHPPRPRHRRRCRPATTTRRASPSASRRSTSSPTAASSSAPASRRREAELGGFGVDRETKREQWERGARRDHAHVRRGAVRRATTGKYVVDAAAQRRAEAAAEAAPAAVGRVQPPRDDPPGGREGHRRAHLRVHRARRRRRHWVDDYYATLESEHCVPGRLRGEPEHRAACIPMMCTRTRQTAIDRGLDGAHFFGYSLAHYYVFGAARPGAHRHLGGVPEATARCFGFAPRRSRRRLADRSARRSCSRGLGSLRGAIGTPEQVRELLRALRGGGRRPGDLRDRRPARTATSTSASRSSCSRREVMPEFHERHEARGEGQARASRAGDGARAGASRTEARRRGGLHGPRGAEDVIRVYSASTRRSRAMRSSASASVASAGYTA